MWSHDWSKHVAVCCVYKLITIYVCKCVCSIILRIQLTYGSCTVNAKLLFHNKHKPSAHNNRTVMLLSEVTVCLREDRKKRVRGVYRLIEVPFKVTAHAYIL
jgi:hypothetical protein